MRVIAAAYVVVSVHLVDLYDVELGASSLLLVVRASKSSI